jgi:anti-sigma B factor antagonist
MLAGTRKESVLMILNATIERVNPTTAVVRLEGRLTLGMRLREIESTISDLTEGGVQRLVVDLAGIEFADSAGLGFIMFLYGKMKTVGGQLRLVTPGPRLLEMFKMTHTDSILTIDPDLASALAS